MKEMDSKTFTDYHRAALEADDVRHNVILATLEGQDIQDYRLWTLGGPGACAIQRPDLPIVLGALDQQQCHRLADEVQDLNAPGVVGSDDTPKWFVERAVQCGQEFHDPIPHRIHALREPPRYPGSPGTARQVGTADIDLYVRWMFAFCDEAVPHEQKPNRDRLEKRAASYFLWSVAGEAVSMAGIVRRTRLSAAITSVYTPPEYRGRGYAGSVTATVVEQIFAEGKAAACLYSDVRNPYSNRCYAKIGFKPVCFSWHFVRRFRADAKC
jgi:GNAT superfamily N-acetyltransferase